MPPWRKGRGLGPFPSAQPAAGPLLSSQLVCPQTTHNSRSLGDPGHANEHLWSVARAAARPTLLALPTDVGPPTGRTRLAVLGVDRYGGGSGARRSKARSTRLLPDQTWVRARRPPMSAGNRCVGSCAVLSPTSTFAARQRRRVRFGCRPVSPRGCAAAVISLGQANGVMLS